MATGKSTPITNEQKALQELAVIRPLAAKSRLSECEILDAMRTLELSRSVVYDKVKSFRAAGGLGSFLPKANSQPRVRKGRLSLAVEQIIQDCIQEVYLDRKEGTGPKDVYASVQKACDQAGEDVPSESSVRRRIPKLPKKLLAKAGKLKGPTTAWDAHPNHHVKRLPLQEVQLDHTLTNVMVDLRDFGLGVRRPWLTIAIDIATRAIYGYYLSIRAPTSWNFMFALFSGTIARQPWFESKGLSYSALCDAAGTSLMPLEGLMDTVSFDNGSDLKSRRVRYACLRLGIHPNYRLIGSPHFGGHIERLIGTFMGRTKILPGTTFSNVVEKADYESEKEALLTIDELDTWFMLDILRYHHSKHRILGCTPIQKYEELKCEMTPCAIRRPSFNELRYAFLPSKGLKVHTQGVTLNHRTYWHPQLEEMSGLDVQVFHQPWDMTTASLSLDGMTEYLELKLMPDGSDISHHDIWYLQRHDPVRVAETQRQEKFANLMRVAELEFIDERKHARNKAKRKPVNLDQVEKGVAPELLEVDQIETFSAGVWDGEL